MAGSRALSPPFKRNGKLINVIIETPRGCRNKFKYDEQLQLFKLKTVLPAGAAFPYDFGFVPGTRAADGDPIDVLVLMDEPAFTGCLIHCRLIGVIVASQTEDGETFRNDRLVAVVKNAHNYEDLRSLSDVSDNLLDELIHFFKSYNEMKHKEFKVIAVRGRKSARKLVERSVVGNHKNSRARVQETKG